MASMSPGEVEQWLSGLKSLIPSEAIRELLSEVRKRQMDGGNFHTLVSSRTTPQLGDSVKPSHMATLRRCWNNDFPAAAVDRCGSSVASEPLGPPSSGQRGLAVASSAVASSAVASSAAPEPPGPPVPPLNFGESAPGRKEASDTRHRDRREARRRESTPPRNSPEANAAARERERREGPPSESIPPQTSPQMATRNGDSRAGSYMRASGTKGFAPPSRVSADEDSSAVPAQSSQTEPWLSQENAPARRSDKLKRGFADENSNATSAQRSSLNQRASGERMPGECHDKVPRPPQVPRLDLSILHQNVGNAGKAEKLGPGHWMKPGKHAWTEQGPPAMDRTSTNFNPIGEAGQSEPAPQGFACATTEDQHRIAEFYGYRDEGFIATMHGLKTDCIRPRLYLGTMADAAYWPLLQSLCVTHILNCAVEAQWAEPPYESEGITYMLLPLHDSLEQAHSLMRQKFRALREATRFIHQSLKTSYQVKNTERKGSVLVHCVQGLNRSAAIVCAYLMEFEGTNMDRALMEVKTKHRGCLSSRHWQELLQKFNAELLRGI